MSSSNTLSTNVITSLVQPNNSLNKNVVSNNITNTIVNEVIKISHLTNPTEIELIKYVGNLIENLVSSKLNLDKLQIFRNVLTLCFPNITTQDITNACNILESLLNNNLI